MKRRSSKAQGLSCVFQCREIAHGRLRWRLVARNVAIAAQAAHLIRREALTARRSASLPIENAGDDVVGVMNAQARKQGDRIFVGVEAREASCAARRDRFL